MAIPFLNNIDLRDNQLQNAKVHVTSSAPSANKGQIYLDSTVGINQLKYYDGTEWIPLVKSTEGTVKTVSSTTPSQVIASTDTVNPTISVVTGDVVTEGTALATGAQIYDFVTALNYSTTEGTVTSITAGEGLSGGTITTSGTISHADTSAVLDLTASARTYVTGLTFDTYGHVTSFTTASESVEDTDTTYSIGAVDGDNNAEVVLTAGGSGSGTDSVTIQGTTNQVSVEGTDVNTITIGLPNDVTINGNLTVVGTTITNNVETISTTNGVLFEGNTADDFEVTLKADTVTADRDIILPDNSGTVALTSDLQASITSRSGSIAVPESDTYTYPNSITSLAGTNSVLIQLVDSNGETVYADVQRLSPTTFSVNYGVTTPTGVVALIQLIG